MKSAQVLHQPEARRYEIQVGDHSAVLEYVDDGKDRHFTHTFVPPELRGQGLAELLVKAGLSDARAAGLNIIPDCSYVAAYLRRTPQ
jgi:predicted GNAT family acetyltransferase